MGFSMYDYVLERRGMNVSTSVSWIYKNKWKVIGNGLAYNLVFLIPFFSWVVAPVNAAVAAAIDSAENELGKS